MGRPLVGARSYRLVMARIYSYSRRGRYVRGDVCPHCSDGEPRSSGLERDIFTVLQLVLGRGERDVPVPTDHRTRLDMRFRGRGGMLIGIEYDGAYWHAGREDADLRKTHRLLSTGITAVVVRIRESPLRPTTHEDMCVGTGESPVVIAIAVLLHLIHIRAVDDDVETRVAAFLAAAAVKVHRHELRCGRCRSMLRHLTLNLDRL
ncbi:hypothetical protein ABQF35_30250 [Mycobacterium syngnathidarum]